MEYQLRMYKVHPGRMDDWLEEWSASVYPLRLEFGFEIVGAWVIDDTDTFVWIVGWRGDGSIDEADRRYYDWPQRAAVHPNPARHLATTEHFAMRPTLPE